ncbi:NADP-dependent oxidoreductase [Citricoccus sp. NPDC055426]|uniref:NADP-dependent oxidoreductase n=1 Tax=Citricoccus sp. NPDC055426 TaxID=3155536 RepID=UPI003444CDB6
MRAFGFTEYGGPEVTRLIPVEDPVPAAGQILIRLRASGVNPADIKVRSGLRQGRIPVRFPMAMGREAAGEVLDVGPGVTGFAAGDEVFGSTVTGTGSMAELVLLEAAATAHRPPVVPAGQAASIPVSVATAYDGLDELELAEGSTLLVLGAGGGVGTAACGLARLRGLRVLGVASESKRPAVEGLGAVHVPKGEGWTDRVRALAPEGVDGVIDAVGGDVLRESTGLLRAPESAGGGVLPVRSVADFGLVSELGGQRIDRRRTTEVFARVAGLVAAGHFTPVVSAAWPLAEAGKAVAAVEHHSPVGNVVVTG